MMKRTKAILIILLSLILTKAYAADTLKVSIRQADSLFLKNNFQLLASSLNIEAQKAQIIQSRLYPNPIITAEINAYDPQHNEVFHAGQSGQKAVSFEQLILLGGKRKSEIELAKTNKVIAELEFQDLLRNLKFQLHTSLYTIHQQDFLIKRYSEQLAIVDTIISEYEVQTRKGNIALKDVVRLKTVYLNLNTQRAEIYKTLLDEIAKVQTILQTQDFVLPIVPDVNFQEFNKDYTLAELEDTAFKNRPDYLISEQNKTFAQQYFTYQRRLAFPDVNLISSYDQRGGAFNNQVNVGIALPLPVWNRNQGNIQASKLRMQMADYSQNGLKNSIRADLQNSFLTFKRTINEFNKAQRLYSNDFEITLNGMSTNFQRRNISLLEFVDFFEAYNGALSEIARIKIQLATSAEQLNYLTAKELY